MSLTAMLCQRPHFCHDCYRWQFPELIVGVDTDGE
jgi:hypothetical protein